MVAGGDRIKVLDFGLAKLRDTAEAATLPTRELTGEGKILGTVAYMSPEQAEGKAVDERSDIFSLGVVLYELATGERPFRGDTSLSVLSAILRDTPRSVTEVNPALPRDVSRIVRHCLAKDPDRRYQSAKDLRNDLEDLAQSLSSGELSPVPAAARTRRSTWPLIAAVVAGVVLMFFIGSLWSRSASTPSALPALSHSRLTQKDSVERFPNISPDGKWVVYAADGDIYLQSVTGQTAINLTKDSPSADTRPVFSPDGETIAFRSARDGGGIFLMGRTGESVRRLTNGGFDPAWFPDGQSIVYAGGEGPQGPENRIVYSDLWVIPVTGAEPRKLFVGDAVQPRVSPHGQRIAFWGIPSDAATGRLSQPGAAANREIWTIDASGGNPVLVASHDANDWNPVWSPDGSWLYFLSNRSGSMNLWRIAIDESSGVARGEPQALTAPAPYVADFSLSADGSIGVYSAITGTNNVARVAFDAKTATVKGDVEMITTGTNDFAYLDVTSDGKSVVATTSSRTREDLYVISVAERTVRQLTNDFARDRFPLWSRDERQIYFSSDRRGYQLWAINADGSGLRELTSGTTIQPLYPLLSPDGTRLAVGDNDRRQVFVYDTSDFSKPVETLTPNVLPTTAAPRINDWSPDGRSIALNAQVPGGGVWIYSLDTASSRRIGDGGVSIWLKDGRRLIYTNGPRLFVIDTTSRISSEVLAGSFTIGNPRLAADDSQLFFLRGTISADIWLVRFEQQAEAP
jgi:Tol biopolymer transport system component